MERDNPSSVYHSLYQAQCDRIGILILVFIYVWSICLYMDAPLWAGIILGTLWAGILVVGGWILTGSLLGILTIVGSFWSWIRGY